MAKRDLGIKVQVTETGIHEGSGLPLRAWVVTTATGYRATINECPCGLWVKLGANRETGQIYGYPITNCLCRAEACHSKPVSKSHKCHGWHQARVDRFVETLAKTTRTHKATPLPRLTYAPSQMKRVADWDAEIARVHAENKPAPWDLQGELITMESRLPSTD